MVASDRQPDPTGDGLDVSEDLLAELRAHGVTYPEIVVSRLGLTSAAADRLLGPLAREGIALILSRALCDLAGVGFVETLEARREAGIRTYGTPLRLHNGRDAVRDALEEALDLALYLRQARLEATRCSTE